MYHTIAQKKCSKTVGRLFADGILAGFLIAVGGYASQLATVMGHPRIVSAAIFPAGLIMVVLTGSELFTGNCLMAGSVAAKDVSLPGTLRVLAVSYIGNLAGALLMVCMIWLTCMTPEHMAVAEKAATAKISMPIPEMMIRAVLCNILVCIAVWMASQVQDAAGKILALFVPVFTFVYCGFEHSIANMFYLPLGGAPAGDAVYQIAVVTAGNLIGGGLTGILLETRKR